MWNGCKGNDAGDKQNYDAEIGELGDKLPDNRRLFLIFQLVFSRRGKPFARLMLAQTAVYVAFQLTGGLLARNGMPNHIFFLSAVTAIITAQ